MKKLLSVLLVLVMMFTMFSFTSAAADEITVDSDFTIAVQNSSDVYQIAAAKELQKYLTEVLGVTLPIEKNVTKSIVICNTGIKSLYANGYRIFTQDGSVFIDGTPTRGYIHGVYRFLEEFANLRIYTGMLREIDKKSSVTVPNKTSILYNPFFEYTDTDFRSPRNTEYSLCNGLTGGVYRSIPTELGGTVSYIGSFAHTLSTQLCSASKYFDKHPEYFALHDGKRTSRQLCLTNPDTLKIVTDDVLNALKANHNPNASLQIVSLTQNDNYDYCECEECKAFENAHGGVHSAAIINFVNQVADTVKKEGYDNVAIDTFAYQYSRQAPQNIVPRENVIVRLCTIEGCFIHSLDDPDCEQNAAIMKDLNDWSKICSRIYIWDYTNNYRNTLSVWPDFDVIQRNIQVFYEHNVKGIYEEGNFYIDSCDGEFGELKSYMISRCLQNPYCDLEKDTDGFLQAYYGDGWKNIKDFIKLAVEKGGRKDGHMSIYEDAEDCLRFKAKDIKAADKMWADALSLAKEDYQKANISRSMLSYRYYKSCAKKGEFSVLRSHHFEENEKLYNDIIASGITSDQEGRFEGQLLTEPYPRYTKANNWSRLSENSFEGIVIRCYSKIIDFIGRIFGKRPTWFA